MLALFGAHKLFIVRGVVVVADQMKDPVYHVEEKFVFGGPAVIAGAGKRRLVADDDAPLEKRRPGIRVHLKRQNVGRPVVSQKLRVQAVNRGIADHGHLHHAAAHPPVGENPADQAGSALTVERNLSRLVCDFNPRPVHETLPRSVLRTTPFSPRRPS